ncbi:glutathionylspermidine synthase family protein [Armatimonas sp.]|uniref:glutathionylspermidine synthase family protein n=1 Tax=Armatimonas sp. TaxID=1872638 RepID=UPI00286BF23E|nr:glutathionylspermidine synthase family protein [Armatimonas sp.]
MTDDDKTARREFFALTPDFWSDVGGEEYALLHTHTLSLAEYQALQEAARAIYTVFAQTAPLLRTLDNATLLQLGLPRETLEVVRGVFPGVSDVPFGRLDLIQSPEGGFKLIEFNTDTPAFIRECFEINASVCGYFGQQDPNAGERDRLLATLARAVGASLANLTNLEARPLIVGTSLDGHVEDSGTTEFICELLRQIPGVDVRHIPISQLALTDDALVDSADGRPIALLYRLYPLEWFAEDRDALGNAHGAKFLSLVQRRCVALLNPPGAFLWQSKAVQALIWGLYEQDSFFDDATRGIIARYFLPSYLDPAFLGERHIVKPVYGREGHSVRLVGESGETETKGGLDLYNSQPMLWQKYVQMPTVTVPTESGEKTLSLLHSVFVLDGDPSAIGLRVCGPITDDDALFLPVAIASNLR